MKKAIIAAAVMMVAGAACAETMNEKINAQQVPAASAKNAAQAESGLELAYAIMPRFGFILSNTAANQEGIMGVRTPKGYIVRFALMDPDVDLKIGSFQINSKGIPGAESSSVPNTYTLVGKNIMLALKKTAKEGVLELSGKAGGKAIKVIVEYAPYGTEGAIRAKGDVALDFNLSGHFGSEVTGKSSFPKETIAAVISMILGMHADCSGFGDI